jgi:hypothetical protein
MKYIVEDSEGKKMFMEVITSLPQLPEGMTILGLADDLLEEAAEVEAQAQTDIDKADARKFLADSDWQVMRHRDQVDAGIPTSLTSQEFADLLTARQAARDSI